MLYWSGRLGAPKDIYFNENYVLHKLKGKKVKGKRGLQLTKKQIT